MEATPDDAPLSSTPTFTTYSLVAILTMGVMYLTAHVMGCMGCTCGFALDRIFFSRDPTFAAVLGLGATLASLPVGFTAGTVCVLVSRSWVLRPMDRFFGNLGLTRTRSGMGVLRYEGTVDGREVTLALLDFGPRPGQIAFDLEVAVPVTRAWRILPAGGGEGRALTTDSPDAACADQLLEHEACRAAVEALLFSESNLDVAVRTSDRGVVFFRWPPLVIDAPLELLRPSDFRRWIKELGVIADEAPEGCL